MGRPNVYNNEWIFTHYDPNTRWSTLLKEYNKTFGTTISYPTFVSYMNRSLKLQQDFHYTKEQDIFLKQSYPMYGEKKTTELFNQKFHANRTSGAIGHHCKAVLGVCVGEERKEELRKQISENNYRRQKIGTVSSGLYGTPAIKTENGWKRLDHIITGTNDQNTYIIHLDRNRNNNNPDNLMIISRYVHARMAKYEFWTDDPVINKTAILWCQLDEALIKSGYKKPSKNKYKHKVKKSRKLPAPRNSTGELFIYETGRKKAPYCVRINRSDLYFDQRFATLDRAKEVRDMLIKGLKT